MQNLLLTGKFLEHEYVLACINFVVVAWWECGEYVGNLCGACGGIMGSASWRKDSVPLPILKAIRFIFCRNNPLLRWVYSLPSEGWCPACGLKYCWGDTSCPSILSKMGPSSTGKTTSKPARFAAPSKIVWQACQKIHNHDNLPPHLPHPFWKNKPFPKQSNWSK